MSLPAPINWLQKVLPELKEEEPESIWGAVGLWDIPIVEQNIFGIPPLFTVVNTSLQKVWLELFPLVHYQFLKEYRFGNLECFCNPRIMMNLYEKRSMILFLSSAGTSF